MILRPLGRAPDRLEKLLPGALIEDKLWLAETLPLSKILGEEKVGVAHEV